MSESTTGVQAPSPEQEIAEIEKAVSTKADETEQTEEVNAFEALAEKKGFKSVDDLVSAYENLESKMNPTMKELKELKEMVKGIQESNKPAMKDPFDDLPEEQREAMDLLGKLLDRQLNSKLSPILKKFEVDEASAQIQGIRKQYPGINDGEIEAAIAMMEKYPKMELSDAIKITSYDRAVSSAKKTTEKTQQKKSTFTESASTARTGDTVDYSKMTLKELESMLEVPEYAR